jgi:diguanylate cyclase (GGDEF)-like protein
MNDRRVLALNRAAAAVRAVVLLTATIMTRMQDHHLAASSSPVDLFLVCGAFYVLLTAVVDRLAPRWRLDTAALVSLDVVYITGLVWRTGGLASEFYLLYYLPILNASMRLDFRQAILSSLLAGLCYTLVTVAAGLDSTIVSSAALQLATFGGSAAVLALFFGSMAALSHSQRDLTAKLQDAVERLSALYRVARAVHARDSLQNVVDTALELAMELAGAPVGYVALSNDAGELLVKSSRAAPDEQEMCERPGFDRHLAEHCLVVRGPVVTDVGGSHPHLPCESAAGRCVVSVPLIYGDCAYGALQLFRRPGDLCDQRAVELLAALAQEASVAIENARLLTEVHRLSVTDELTGLYHRSEFLRLLAAEVERARSSREPLTVLLFDVDGMREINSQHGYAAGDEVLLAFADLLRRLIRAQDIAARYGADEFAVLLPGGGIDAARAVSTRLCQAMAHRQFHFGGEQVHHFTLCAGAVVVGEMPNSAEQLIGRADEALFEARQAGPGQIRFWEATVKRGIVTQVRQIVEQVQHSSEQWR